MARDRVERAHQRAGRLAAAAMVATLAALTSANAPAATGEAAKPTAERPPQLTTRAASLRRLAVEGRAAPWPRPRPADLPRPALRTAARSALVVDLSRDELLFERRADQAIPPASMTKLMTLYVALEAVADGEVAMTDRLPVSGAAAARDGSSMFLKKGQRPRLSELLTGLMVVSGNDAAVAIAEGLDGDVAGFVARMNAAARRLGLEHSRFKNPSGLPAEGHQMSAHDLARLAERLLREHPEATRLTRKRDFRWGQVAQRSRNPLLFADLSDIGVRSDGLKTGYTKEAGYCAVISAVGEAEDGSERRVIAVLAGLPSEAARAREAERVLRWAFETPR